MFHLMYFPTLENGQYAVVKIKIDSRSLSGASRSVNLRSGLWRVFDSLGAARNYANAAVAARPSVECGIYNARQELVQSVRIYLPPPIPRPYKSLQAA
jgi:hypothetical protein